MLICLKMKNIAYWQIWLLSSRLDLSDNEYLKFKS